MTRRNLTRHRALAVSRETAKGAPVLTFEVALIPIGSGVWAALLATGHVLLTETRSPRSEVAAALLRQGADPRSRLIIRAGARVVADEMLGVVSGNPVICGDVDVIERD